MNKWTDGQSDPMWHQQKQSMKDRQIIVQMDDVQSDPKEVFCKAAVTNQKDSKARWRQPHVNINNK